MADKFLMPKLSPTMEEGQIARWVKNEGDDYGAGETLAEVDTDKATMEMTALQGGTLLKILKAAGETAALGEAIAITGEKGEDIEALLKEVSSNGSKSKPSTTEDTEKPAKSEAPASADDKTPTSTDADSAGQNPQSAIRNPQSKP
ncbi:MAG: biotin/lipoyl-containing protein [Pyrinomonadaceae bacterium]